MISGFDLERLLVRVYISIHQQHNQRQRDRYSGTTEIRFPKTQNTGNTQARELPAREQTYQHVVPFFSTNCKRTLPGSFRNNPKHSALTQTNQIRCCCTHAAASQPKPRVEMKE